SGSLHIYASWPAILYCCKTTASLRRHRRRPRPLRALTSRPSNRTRPSLGSIRRLIRRNSVDFPAPERPMTPTNAPCRIAKDACATADVAPNRRDRSSTTSIGPLFLDQGLAGSFYTGVTGGCGIRYDTASVEKGSCHAHVIEVSSSRSPLPRLIDRASHGPS